MTRLLVKTAAALVPGEHAINARSGRPLTLIHAASAENENPDGRWMAAWLAGESIMLLS